jgi:2-(1,2-epoxy-1,2-dihydrophenyl)acetyl-CoA isomerase
MFEFIKYTTEAQTAVITINRPDVYNALNTKSKSEIIQAIELANSDSLVRSIILTA